MKVAILHEMLVKLGWAEKVVESIRRLYPSADLYTLIYDETVVGNIFPKKSLDLQCHRLPSQKIYNLFKKQRLCLPFMSRSVESLDFSNYDLVIVSSSGFAHGLITKPETKTVVYYHAPARYMWDRSHEHTRDIGLDKGIKWYLFSKLLLKLRQWDYIAAQRNDIILANSNNTQGRILKYFRRDAEILYPPVETKRFSKQVESLSKETIFSYKNYYIIISALTEFKRLDIAIQAFNKMPESQLIIIWDGDYKQELAKLTEENILFAWARFWDELVALVQSSNGLIFPGEEDFWIVPIEVMAAWKPVFALGKWWLTESIVAGKTGDFFYDSEGSDFIEKFKKFHKKNLAWVYKNSYCIKRAEEFSEEVFHKKLKKYEV